MSHSSCSDGAAATGAVQGVVIAWDTGEPVADATVTIVSGAGPAPDIAPVTGADGRFGFGGLQPGLWVFQAFAPDASTGQAQVEVSAGTIVDVTIVVGPPPWGNAGGP